MQETSNLPPPYWSVAQPSTTDSGNIQIASNQPPSNDWNMTQPSIQAPTSDNPSYSQDQQPPVVEVQPVPIVTPVYQQTEKPNDCLVWSILGCLCCICPIGICAIALSVNSRRAWQRGDYDSAKASAVTAKRLNITSMVTGLTVICLASLYVIVGGR